MPFIINSASSPAASRGRGKSSAPFTKGTDSLYPAQPNLTSPNNLPLFLIPDIFGGKVPNFNELSTHLKKKSPHRPIYHYYDDAMLNPSYNNYAKKEETLSHQARLIANQISEHMQLSYLPPIIVGYSYGCMLAVEAAKLLTKSRGIEPIVYLIDGITPAASKQFYLSEKSTQELIDIINVAAQLYGLTPLVIPNDDLKTISNMISLTRKLEAIRNRLINFNREPAMSQKINNIQQRIDAFDTTYKIIKTNMQCIASISGKINYRLPPLSTIHLFGTNATAAKLNGIPDEGWEVHARKVYRLNDVADVPHTDLLNDNNARIIAELIHHSILTTYPRDKLAKMQMQCILGHQHIGQDVISSSETSSSEESYGSPSDSLESILFNGANADESDSLPDSSSGSSAEEIIHKPNPGTNTFPKQPIHASPSKTSASLFSPSNNRANADTYNPSKELDPLAFL